ncbi:SRR1-like protein isoform X4 [Xenopus laevis]|uniref:SRR1-like protein isoform X4 n=1 Tax=Xenopus laevis TaxID=8355 RepID=A0A8J0V7R3_XENLA|nr:SRR1-like protein isoform X4 [Xenopus laevis]
MESNEWQMVKKKKSARRKDVLNNEKPPDLSHCESENDCKNLTQRIFGTIENIKTSEFWNSCQKPLKQCLHIHETAAKDWDPCKGVGADQCFDIISKEGHFRSLSSCDCVCYGLGNFSLCVTSRCQLAFLLLFLELFKEGKHIVDKSTVFYMLHCGKALYNNLLWRNWSAKSLSEMIIIGNSFKGIEERLLSRILQRDYVYIHKSLQAVEETPFPENSQYSDVFNDTSVHRFPAQKLRTLANEFWECAEEPCYQECEDLEIIRNQNR